MICLIKEMEKQGIFEKFYYGRVKKKLKIRDKVEVEANIGAQDSSYD